MNNTIVSEQGHLARLVEQDDLDSQVDRAIAAGRSCDPAAPSSIPQFEVTLAAIATGPPRKVGTEPVSAPTGATSSPGCSRVDVDAARAGHRIEFAPENKRKESRKRLARLEWPVPPSEVWSDHEWEFWPERSVPRYGFKEWERHARSLLWSYLMTKGLVILNHRESAEGRSDFGAADVEWLTAELVAAGNALPLRRLWWDEAQVVGVVPGLGSRAEAAKHYAGRRLPLSVLRAAAARVARVLLVGGDQPHRVWSRADADAWHRWLARPIGRAPRVEVTTSAEERTYFSIYGHYPPVWRPKAQAFSELQARRGTRSGERRQPERLMLLELPGGLTASQTVAALAERGVVVTSRTVTKWRNRLKLDGVVPEGQEPWRTTKGRPRNP